MKPTSIKALEVILCIGPIHMKITHKTTLTASRLNMKLVMTNMSTSVLIYSQGSFKLNKYNSVFPHLIEQSELFVEAQLG